MKIRTILLNLLVISAVFITLIDFAPNATAPIILSDDIPILNGTDVPSSYEMEVLPISHAVVGVRSLLVDNHDIEVYTDDTYSALIDSSTYPGGIVDFVVLNKTDWASPPNRGVRVTSGSKSYVIEMENDVDDHAITDIWSGSMDTFSGNPVLDLGSPGSWEDVNVYSPTVAHNGTIYHMWYIGDDGPNRRIGHATSPDGITWIKDGANPVLSPGPSTWERQNVGHPAVLYNGATFQMWYGGSDGSKCRIGYATSSDGITWTKHPSNPVIDVGPTGSWEDHIVTAPTVFYDGTTYQMWYHGHDYSNYRIGYATSPDGISWTKNPTNPVLDLGTPGSWEDTHVNEPMVFYNGAIYQMWYSGHDGTNAKIGYATSTDGVSWTKNPTNPVLDLSPPGYWDDTHIGGPTILYDGTTYHMWFSGHDGSNRRIGYATSTDQVNWTKFQYGEVLDAYEVINVQAGNTYIITLQMASTLDLDLFIFNTTGGRENALVNSTNIGAGVEETVSFIAPSSGDYLLVITNEDGGAGNYVINLLNTHFIDAGEDQIVSEGETVSFHGFTSYPGDSIQFHPCWPVDISGNGEYMAIGWDKNVTFFSTASNVPLWTHNIGGQGRVGDLKLTEDGRYLVVGCYDSIYYYNTTSSTPLWSVNTGIRFDSDSGNRLDMTSDGRYVAAVAIGNTVRVFDTTTPIPPTLYWDISLTAPPEVVRFSGDGNYLAMGGWDTDLTLGWIPGRGINWSYNTGDVIYSSSISYDGNRISTGEGNSHKVSLLSSGSNIPIWTHTLEGRQFEQVLSHDGNYLASGNHYDGFGGTWSGFAFWNTSTSTPIWTYTTGTTYGFNGDAIDMDPNANYVVGGSKDTNVYLFGQLSDGTPDWSASDNTPIFTYSTGGQINYNGVSISADGTYFAAGSWDGCVYLFSTVGSPYLVWKWNNTSLLGSVGYSWDFDSNVDVDGDGNFTNDGEAEDQDVTHVYGDDGVYTVTLSIFNASGVLGNDTCNITVNNVVPSGDIGGPYTGEKGVAIAFLGTATDPGSDDLTITWDWGDGTSDNITIYYNNGIGPDPFPSPNGTFPFSKDDALIHTYDNYDVYTVYLTIEDDDGGSVTYSTTITIRDDSPETKVWKPSRESEPEEYNWKPIIALIFAIILLILGIIIAHKKPIKFTGDLRDNRMITFRVLVFPYILAEVLIGFISFFTGYFRVPPIVGIGMLLDLIILIFGLITCLVIIDRGTSPEEYEGEQRF